MLSVGIIGLPNVGKSTLFNALTAGAAQVSNYPFTTIDSNVGMVPVPDERLAALAGVLSPQETTPCHVRFTDIAGLVEGASEGEGLGNQFLGNIRQVDAVAHVVRCFDDPEVAHVYTDVDPVRDAEAIQSELLVADLELLERAVAKREKEWKTHPRETAAERERWSRYREALEAGRPLRSLELGVDERREMKALGLLTGRPLLYVANLAEDDAEGAAAAALREKAAAEGTAVVAVSARLEGELGELDPGERGEFMEELGLATTGLERLVEACFDRLGLVRFYTIANDKLRAWEVPRGTRAPQAAGKIHSDMEEGFIRARVASAEELLEYGSFKILHEEGLERTEGKDYVVAEGDVVEFLFRSG